MSATWAAAVLATTVRLVASHAYAEGAPAGFSGGFKEDTCRACHFDFDLNTGGGRVTIDTGDRTVNIVGTHGQGEITVTEEPAVPPDAPADSPPAPQAPEQPEPPPGPG